MVTWKTDVDTIPLHTVLIVSDQPENIAAWDSLFSQRNCVVVSEGNISTALRTSASAFSKSPVSVKYEAWIERS